MCVKQITAPSPFHRQAGKVSHALSAGSIVSAGELLAKLQLKDPSKAPGRPGTAWDMGRFGGSGDEEYV